MACRILSAVCRKKTSYQQESSKLAKILKLWDLVIFGLGATLGLGAYVIPGQVAKSVAGPAVCFSFLIAALIAAIGGLCYAEFSARVPKAGFAYVFTYVSVGEGLAFIIGWNIVFGCLLSLAGTARSLTAYIDVLTENQITNTLREALPLSIDYFSEYPDLLSCGFVIVGTVLFSMGLKQSSLSQWIFATINILTIFIALIATATKIDINNWKISQDEIEPEYKDRAGTGGFFPFGFAGIISGVTRCFYGFSGFEIAANCGEEAKNPRKDIPLSIILSAVIVSILYVVISLVLTLALPYYLQGEEAAFVHLFQYKNLSSIKWIVTLGTVSALSSVFLSCYYPITRIMYAMASDGLIFKCFGYVYPRTKVPLNATIFTGILACFVATFINLDALLDLFSFSYLLSYLVISSSIITLRYEFKTGSSPSYPGFFKSNPVKHMLNLNCLNQPTEQSANIVKGATILFSALCFITCIVAIRLQNWFPPFIFITIIVILSSLMLFLLFIIRRQPQNKEDLHFKVPLVPYLPSMCIIINSYLLVQLTYQTWIISLVWISLGCLLYVTYGFKHSHENEELKALRELNTTIDSIQLE